MPAKRRQPKAPPIDLDEIAQDPGFRGMLSFLEVSPAEKAALLAERDAAETQSPMGHLSMGDPTPVFPQPEPPMGKIGDLPLDQSPMGETVPQPMGDLPVGSTELHQLPAALPMGHAPMGHPYMDVEGRGKRPLHFCQTVQDGHTASEHLAYQALWNHARTYGLPEDQGAILVDIGLSQLRSLLRTDHKNVKRLMGSLQEKLAIEVFRQPDYRLAIPTRYRVFSQVRIMERRRAAGLRWVVRTRAVRFVDPGRVEELLAQAARSNSVDSAVTTTLTGLLNQWITIDDAAVSRLWEACRLGSPDCTEEEVAWFCRTKEPLIASGRIDDPVALLHRTVPPIFTRGGTAALWEYRKEHARTEERRRRHERQAAQMMIDDPAASEAELAWANEILGRTGIV